MTNEVNPLQTLEAWWLHTNFPGKEFCELTGDGQLQLRQTEFYPARSLGTLSIENIETTIPVLVEKFAEVAARVAELQTEWDTVDDRLQLIGKVSRLSEYLLHSCAVGDFSSLFIKLREWDEELRQRVEDNYRQKLALVLKAEEISVQEKKWKESSHELKEIVEQWKSLGFVEKERNDALWNRIDAARTKFFDRKKAYLEEQEKDMLLSLDLKLEIVEKAEKAAASEDWKEATNLFHSLMEEWKNAGRITPEKNEELWAKFVAAQNCFFERKKIHFETIQAEQEANYAAKLAIAEKAESINQSRDWKKTTQAYATMMEEWKNIGRVPPEKSDEIWERFNNAKEVFFNNKRQHREVLRITMEDNYAQKLALLKRAEELKESKRWREATQELNELMNEWKKIGPVPRQHSNTIWQKFIDARKTFFQRKDEDREKRRRHEERQFEQFAHKTSTFLVQLKEELLEEQNKLADFQEALENVTPGNKETELRNHLTKLIGQCEVRIQHKQSKIGEVEQQMNDLKTQNKKPQLKTETTA